MCAVYFINSTSHRLTDDSHNHKECWYMGLHNYMYMSVWVPNFCIPQIIQHTLKLYQHMG